MFSGLKKKILSWFGKREKETAEKKEEEDKKQDLLKKEDKIKDKEDGFFSKIIKKITNYELKKEDFDGAFEEVEISLLENNVALEVVEKIKESLEKNLVGKKMKKGDAERKIKELLKEAVLSVLIEPEDLIEKIKNKEGVFCIIFFGINGTGKTTTIAKIANKLKKEGISCILAAGDTFRAASIEQLEKHAKNLSIPIIKHEYGSDAAAVGFDAIKYAEKNKIKVVLIDTAGRMYTKINLLKEMEKIIRVCKPDLKIFVGESIAGNDVIEQAKTFNEAIGIDGIILSKADVDEKAGAILSVGYITGKPIYYLGVGQNYEDLMNFSKKEILNNLGFE